MNTSGVIDMSGMEIRSMDELNIGPSTRVLDVSFTEISNLEGLNPKNGIKKFIADNCPIENLKGFANLTNCYSLSLIGTPFIKKKTAKLTLVLLFGNKLSSLNKSLIPQSIIKKAEEYQDNIKLVRKLINLGWVVEYPCPSLEDLELVLNEYLVEQELVEEEEEEEEQNEENDDNEEDMEQWIMEMRNKHLQTVQDAIKRFDSITESVDQLPINVSVVDEDAEPLSSMLLAIFKKYNIPIDKHAPKQSIINSVKELFEQCDPFTMNDVLGNPQINSIIAIEEEEEEEPPLTPEEVANANAEIEKYTSMLSDIDEEEDDF